MATSKALSPPGMLPLSVWGVPTPHKPLLKLLSTQHNVGTERTLERPLQCVCEWVSEKERKEEWCVCVCLFGIAHFLNVMCGNEAWIYNELASSLQLSMHLWVGAQSCVHMFLPHTCMCLKLYCTVLVWMSSQMRCSLDVHSEVALLYSQFHCANYYPWQKVLIRPQLPLNLRFLLCFHLNCTVKLISI